MDNEAQLSILSNLCEESDEQMEKMSKKTEAPSDLVRLSPIIERNGNLFLSFSKSSHNSLTASSCKEEVVKPSCHLNLVRSNSLSVTSPSGGDMEEKMNSTQKKDDKLATSGHAQSLDMLGT